MATVESERLIEGMTSEQVGYYISSLASRAETLLYATRGHWGIENSVHWILDVAFGEDDCRVRTGNAAESFSTLRRMALNMLKCETRWKGGIAAKRKRAGWVEDYMITVLNS